MTRKTSTYARRMRRQPDGGTFNGAQWFNTLQRCRGYTDEPLPGSFLPGHGATLDTAKAAALRVRGAFDSLKSGHVPPNDTEPHDLMAHAMGVSWLRAVDIAGDDPATNPMLPIVKAGTEAVQRMAQRRRERNAWGFDGPGLQAMADALDVYEEILLNSSPAQMADASETRARMLMQMHSTKSN